MSARIKNMTRDQPAGLIFTFALPLMRGSVFQQLYTPEKAPPRSNGTAKTGEAAASPVRILCFMPSARPRSGAFPAYLRSEGFRLSMSSKAWFSPPMAQMNV